MTPREIKNLLMDKGLSVADIARSLCKDFPHVTEKSMYSMIDDMIWGRNYYPKYAKLLMANFGIKIIRPQHLRPAKEQLKAA